MLNYYTMNLNTNTGLAYSNDCQMNIYDTFSKLSFLQFILAIISKGGVFGNGK
jgi:hypothetical protein